MTVRVNVTARVDDNAVRGWIAEHVTNAVQRAAGRGRDYAKAEITKAGRVDKGQMRNGVVAEVVRVDGNQVVGRIVATAEHSVYQHEGTTGPIVPRRARVLRFRPKGGGAFVFTPQVSGVEGVPFLTIALDRLAETDFT